MLADPNNPIHREPSSSSNGAPVGDLTPPTPQKSGIIHLYVVLLI